MKTPCWVVEKASWPDEQIFKGDLETIIDQVKHIKGVALILFGEYLNQEAKAESHLYDKKYKAERLKDKTE